MTSVRVERAAGGVVLCKGENGVKVLMIHDAYGHVTFPKGHVELGETWEQAAIREIAEETGIDAKIVAPLGRVEYPIEQGGEPVRKQVRLFLLEAVDSTQSPVPQEEEVNGAFYTHWDDAVKQHCVNGYANWSWVLPKVDALWQWYERGMEEDWRLTSAKLPLSELQQIWSGAVPLVKQMIDSVADELAVVAPEWFDSSPRPVQQAYDLPLPIEALPTMEAAIEHTLLKPESSLLDVLKVVNEAREYHFGAVCVNPQHIGSVAESLVGTRTIPCVVVGFPLGASALSALAAETKAVVEAGARDVDMVIPVGSMREDDVWSVYERVAAVVAVAHASGAKVKVILETCFLTMEQVIKAGIVALHAGADFLKTSTGFASAGAKVMDVAILKVVAGASGEVKAAGGIRSREEAENFLRFGASRLGTSSGVAMLR